MVHIEFQETEDTISLKVFHGNYSMQQHFLDADDDRWELTIDTENNTSTLLTSTNGDFVGR